MQDVRDKAIADGKSWPENTTFAYWWQTAEDIVLSHMAEYAQKTTDSHLSLHFDGLMVVRDRDDRTAAQFGAELTAHVLSQTGLSISVCQKLSLTFMELIERCQVREEVDLTPYIGTQGSLSVFERKTLAMALGQATGEWSMVVSVATGVIHGEYENTYKSWETNLARLRGADHIVLQPRVGIHVPTDSSQCCLLHTGSRNAPVVLSSKGQRRKLRALVWLIFVATFAHGRSPGEHRGFCETGSCAASSYPLLDLAVCP